jgi:hypothetical protein
VKLLIRPIGVLFVLLAFGLVGMSSVVLAQVWTAQPAYVGGESVNISGDGMTSGETVGVEVFLPDGSRAQHHEVVADESGNFSDVYVLPDPAQGGTYGVVATGLASGATFTTTFEDGAADTSVTPTSVSVTAGAAGAAFAINTTVNGAVGAGWSFSIDTVYTISGGACTGSSPVIVPVAAQGGGPTSTLYSTAASVSAVSGQAGGAFSCAIQETISDGGGTATGAALAAGSAASLSVAVSASAATATSTATPTGTATNTATPTDTPTNTATPTDTPTNTATAVPNVSPTADAGGPYSGDEGASIALSAAGSFDTDGFIVSYEWDLDNDGSYDDATGVAASVTFPDDGVFTVGVKVTDNDGGSATGSVTVTVDNLDPLITLVSASPSTVDEGTSSVISVSATDVPADLPDLRYSFDCDGDGAYEVVPQADSFTGCAFPDGPASVSVGVKVTDGDGGSATGSATVTVLNVAATVNAGTDQSATWTNGGTPVSLLGPPSFSDPGTDTHTCNVDWGDGTAATPGAVAETVGNPPAGICEASHVYNAPGAYGVTVTVCDSDGACGNDTLTISIGVQFYGFLQPLNDPAVSISTPSLWKRGSNIPLKFQLRDASGAPLPDILAMAIAGACPANGPRASITKILLGGLAIAAELETSSSPTADGGVCFRYDTIAHQFIYNLGSKTSFYTVLPDGYKATATVTFNGGVIASHTQANTFGLK